jgi:hypothetical protein
MHPGFHEIPFLKLISLAVSPKDGLASRLNKKLDSTEFGPFCYVHEAANKLQHLSKKKPNKATELWGCLAEFAAEEGIPEEAFAQWPALLPMKDRR